MKCEYVRCFTTGSFRGYTHAADCGVESEMLEVPADLKSFRGNMRKVMELFKREGCTHYTVEQSRFHNSNLYSYKRYNGYKEEG